VRQGQAASVIRTSCDRHDCWRRLAREWTAGRTRCCSAPIWFRARCASFYRPGASSRTVRYDLERLRRRVRAEKMGAVCCLSGGPGPANCRPRSDDRNPGKPVGIVSTTRSRYPSHRYAQPPGFAARRRVCLRTATRGSAHATRIKRHGKSAVGARDLAHPEESMPWKRPPGSQPASSVDIPHASRRRLPGHAPRSGCISTALRTPIESNEQDSTHGPTGASTYVHASSTSSGIKP